MSDDHDDVPGLLPAAEEVVEASRRAVELLRQHKEWGTARALQNALDTYDKSLARAQSTARQIKAERQADRDRLMGRFR